MRTHWICIILKWQYTKEVAFRMTADTSRNQTVWSKKLLKREEYTLCGMSPTKHRLKKYETKRINIKEN